MPVLELALLSLSAIRDCIRVSTVHTTTITFNEPQASVFELCQLTLQPVYA